MGTTIGRYYVRSRLGTGGQGEVYCADDLKLNRTVALKRLSPALRTDERYRQRFLREAQRASGLNDAHIAGIYDVLEHEGELLLVMEYVQGSSLRQQLREPLILPEFLKVAKQACEALIAAHESGVVHRDIKPENIMLTRTGRVKVLDFGIAKRLPAEDDEAALDSTETKAGEISGTPAYMAPELLLQKDSDARTDIFSLGVVCYELLTGRHPFLVQGSLVATVDRILHEEPQSICQQNHAVPAALERIVLKMLAKNPAERYGSANDLLADLGTIPPVPDNAVQAFLWRLRKRRAIVAVVSAIVLAALAVVVIAKLWPPKPSIFAERDWVLIADPENTTGQPIFNDSLREALTIALQQSRYVNVLPRPRVYEALERMKRTGVVRIDETLGRELCQRENVRVLLASSIRSSGDALQITVRAIRPGSGDLLFAETEQLKNKDQFFERVDALAKRVRNNLGESTPKVEASSKPLEKVTTRSLEALQLYSEASNAIAKGNMQSVQGLLESALQLDADFAMAHARLGMYYSWIVGRNQKAITELQRAYDLRHGVTDREQRWIEQSYYNIQERYDEAAQSLNVLVNLYPDDAEAHEELASAYYNLGQLDAAIEELRKALRLNPFSVRTSGTLVVYLAGNNAEDEAIHEFKQASERGIDSPTLQWGLGLAYLGQNKLPEARQQFQRLAADKAFRGLGERYLVRVTLYEGKLTAAAQQLKATLGPDHKSTNGAQTIDRALLGRTYLIVGAAGLARQQADLILAAPESDLQTIDLLSAGSLYSNAGQPGRARHVLAQLDAAQKIHATSWNKSTFHLLAGEIALAEGKHDQAISQFLNAEKEYPQFLSHLGLARAYQAEQKWELAAHEWQEVLNARGRILFNGFPPDLVMANLELARNYRNLKKKADARIYYELFTRLWRNAENLPVRKQAAKELSSLLQ